MNQDHDDDILSLPSEDLESHAMAEPTPRPLLSRREALTIIGAAGAVSVVAAGSPAWAVCSLTPQQTEGPFWVDELLNRSDITYDPSDGSTTPGVPLTLNINVLRADASCAPAAGVQVDVWHCNAGGLYSDEASNGTAGKKFLRGYQITDQNGAVQFLTIYPGWYVSRTIHIHFRIRTFDGSTTTYNFTSQLYFDDTISDQVIANNPEYNHGTRGTNNGNDNLYTAATLLTLVDDGNGGYIGTFDVALNGLPVGSTTPTPTPAMTPSPTPTPGPCMVVPVADPNAKVRITTHNGAGRLSANMVIDLASYASEPVTVSLSDADTPTIAAQSVGALLPVGLSGKKWRFKTTADGVRRVILKSLAPRQPGKFKLSVNAKHWFMGADADQAAADTLLAVQIGELCFTHTATKKVD